ncbi:MAG: CPBP family intramembrane metalloprotease [Polyangiaceae bacterium]|nr:CPBP family intramembrane metalloprotease [Polyangiaceae bacterium]
MDSNPSEPLTAKQRLSILGTGAAWLLGIRAALLILAGVLGSSPLPEAVLGALIVDLATGRAGLPWSEDDLKRGEALRRAMLGAGVGAGVAALALGISLAAGWGTGFAGHADVTSLMAFVPAGAIAVRDELLYRGLPLLFAARAGLPIWTAVAFGALASPSTFAGGHPSAAAIALAVSNGALFGTLYVRTKSAWGAVGAHAAWALVTDMLARGTLFEVRWGAGELATGEAAAGPPAFVGAALALVVTAWLALSPRSKEKAVKPAAR